MPTARLKLQPREHQVVLVEIQGVINIGDSPLVRTELDLDSVPSTEKVVDGELLDLGNLQTDVDFSNLEAGQPLELIIGQHQLLRGVIQKLNMPLALLKMESSTLVPVVQVVTHKLVFSKRPQPVNP